MTDQWTKSELPAVAERPKLKLQARSLPIGAPSPVETTGSKVHKSSSKPACCVSYAFVYFESTNPG
eukprot:7922166-Pyramimonas_sp.AAC.3